ADRPRRCSLRLSHEEKPVYPTSYGKAASPPQPHEIGGRTTLKGCSVSFLSPCQIWITQIPGTMSERLSNFQVRNSSSPTNVFSTYSSPVTAVFPSPAMIPSGGK